MTNTIRGMIVLFLIAVIVVACEKHHLTAQPDKSTEPATVKSSNAQTPHGDFIDYSMLTKASHTIALDSKIAASIKPGQLVSLGMGEPIVSVKRLPAKFTEYSSTTAESNIVSSRDTSAKSSAFALRVAAAFGPTEGEVAFSKYSQSSEKQESLFVLMSTTTGVQALDGAPIYPADWKLPSGADALHRQLRSGGSHLATRIVLGRSFSAILDIHESSSERREEASAALRTAFMGLRIDGSVAASSLEHLSRYRFGLRLAIRAEMVGGTPEALLITNLEDLMKLLSALQSGQLKLRSTPVYAELASLSEVLADGPLAAQLRGVSPPVFAASPPKQPGIYLSERVSLRWTEPQFKDAFAALKRDGFASVKIPFTMKVKPGAKVLPSLCSFDSSVMWIHVAAVHEDCFELHLRTRPGQAPGEADIYYLVQEQNVP